MKPTAWFAALAVGDIAQVTIIDCSTGAALTPHLHHGEYRVAGRPGTTYALEIHNHLDERVLAVTSVDGVNVISGATAAWNQTGYVFRPQQNYRITGWRKSDDEVAAFTFTASPNSCSASPNFYAARTGRLRECWCYRALPCFANGNSHRSSCRPRHRRPLPTDGYRRAAPGAGRQPLFGLAPRQYAPDPPPGVRGDSL